LRHVGRKHPHDVAADFPLELIGPAHDVEDLVPRHLRQREVDLGVRRHARVDDDVDLADVVAQEPQHPPQVGALEIDVRRGAAEPPALTGRRRGEHRSLYAWRRALRARAGHAEGRQQKRQAH
jgi:hypothetical protein